MANDTGNRVVERIAETCDNLGQVELAGIKLEEADPRLLDVSQLSFDQHVAMQPAAIAYFGVLRKEAARRLGRMEKAYDRWEKKQWAKAKAAFASGAAKTTVDDIKARFVVDNEPDIEKWEDDIEKLQREKDTLDEWYEAWRQKSYSIREFADIEGDEIRNTATNISAKEKKDGASSRIENIRRIIRSKREGQTS